jgi:hypothetical protein
VRSLQAQIAEQEATRLSLEKQRRQLNPASQQAQRMAAQITFLKASVDLRKQELDVTRQQVQLEEYRRTGLGAFVTTLRDSVKNTSAELGQLAANQFLGLAQRISGAFSTIFTDMITQPEQALSNFGKSILSALGDVALSFAAVFAAKAVGYLFVPGGQATAAGLFGASAGLGVLGGLLKGGAAVVGGQGKASTGTAAGAAPSSTFRCRGVGLAIQRQPSTARWLAGLRRRPGQPALKSEGWASADTRNPLFLGADHHHSRLERPHRLG